MTTPAEEIRTANALEFKIEKNIPIPVDANFGRSKYPFGELAIGDSFFVKAETVKPMNIKNAAHSYGKSNSGFKLVCRQVRDHTGVTGTRVWRVAADVLAPPPAKPNTAPASLGK